MYFTNLFIWGMPQYPLLIGSIYQRVAEVYKLPGIETLLQSVQQDIEWPVREGKMQVSLIDDLMRVGEENRMVIQVRFTSSAEAKQFTSVYLSFREGIAQNLGMSFEGRAGGGGISTTLLAAIKSVAHNLKVDTRNIRLEINGFPHTSPYIREYNLSAFVWNEQHERYFHVREDVPPMRERRTGIS